MFVSLIPQLSIFLLVLSLFLGPVESFAAGRMAVPRTRISMVMPAGFVMDVQLNAFTDTKTGATILFSEVPASPEMTTRGFTEEGFRAQGMKLLAKKEKRTFGKLSGFVVEAAESTPKKTDHKFIVAFGEIETMMVAATYPSTLSKERTAEIKTALLSAQLRDEFKEEELDKSVPAGLKELLGVPAAVEK